MISTQASQNTTSEYCTAIRQQLHHHPDPDALVVCLGKSETEGFYFPPIDTSNPLVLKIEGISTTDAWEAIKLALDSTDIKSLIVCSHSRSAMTDDSESAAAPSSFVRGVIESQNRMNQSKKQFAESMSDLKKRVEAVCQNGEDQLSIVGFFYLVESSLFLVLDEESSTFHSLTPVAAN